MAISISEITSNISPVCLIGKVNEIIKFLAGGVRPVGTVYVQYAGKPSPSDLFGGTWRNVSEEFGGRTFRVEGGKAAAFGETQEAALPTIKGLLPTHNGSFSLMDQGREYGAFYVYLTTNGAASRDTVGNYCSIAGFDAALSNAIYGDSEEPRTANATIRIWERTG